jgi:hypothetical protein
VPCALVLPPRTRFDNAARDYSLEWDYAGPSDDGLPFEWKPSDWGYLDDRVVAVDYAATVEL